MFEYCKICPCNIDDNCLFGIEEEPIDDRIIFCLYPKLYDKEWYNQYIRGKKENKND